MSKPSIYWGKNLNPEVFLGQFWGQNPLYLPSGLDISEIDFTPEDLAGLSLEEGVESRMVFENQQGKAWQLTSGPFSEETFNIPAGEKWTLLVQGINYLIPDFHFLLQAFDFIPFWRLDDVMVSYAPTGGSVGPHYDHYDVFLIQLSGERLWQLTDEGCHPQNQVAGTPLRIMEKFATQHTHLCQPGDILYIPAGVGHYGVSQSEDCMTISVGYRSYQRQEIWDSLGDYLAECQEKTYLSKIPLKPTRPGAFSPAEVDQAFDFASLFTQEQRHIWFGRFITQLDASAMQWLAEPQALPYASFAQLTQQETLILRTPTSRLAYIEQLPHVLFVNGEIIHTHAQQQTLSLLCDQLVYAPSQFVEPTQEDWHLVKQLFDKGVLALDWPLADFDEEALAEAQDED